MQSDSQPLSYSAVGGRKRKSDKKGRKSSRTSKKGGRKTRRTRKSKSKK